jgi:hypothetical protein
MPDETSESEGECSGLIGASPKGNPEPDSPEEKANNC